MFCPKCGSSVENGNAVCGNCGFDFASIKEEKRPQEKETAPVAKGQNMSENTVIRYVYFGLAAVVLVMFFIAAGSIVAGGKEIMQIQSVGGSTLEEAYYAELGNIYSGYAMISRALGIFFASVLVWLGVKK